MAYIKKGAKKAAQEKAEQAGVNGLFMRSTYDIRSATDRTRAVTDAVVRHYAKTGYSCYVEIAVLPWGSRRIDILGVNTKRDIVGVEVKQCWSDFRNDRKWTEYLPYVNRLYFAFPFDLWADREDDIREMLGDSGATVGVIVLGATGHCRVVKPCSHRDIKGEDKRDMITRMAWRGGLSSRLLQRTRVLLS